MHIHNWVSRKKFPGWAKCRTCGAIAEITFNPDGDRYYSALICTKEECFEYAISKKPQLCNDHLYIKRQNQKKTVCDSCMAILPVNTLGNHRLSLKCYAESRRIHLISIGKVPVTEYFHNSRVWQLLHAAGLVTFESTQYSKGYGYDEHSRSRILSVPWTFKWADDLIRDEFIYFNDYDILDATQFGGDGHGAKFKYSRKLMIKLLKMAVDESNRAFILEDVESIINMMV